MEHLPIYPAFEKSNLAITMQTSDLGDGAVHH